MTFTHTSHSDKERTSLTSERRVELWQLRWLTSPLHLSLPQMDWRTPSSWGHPADSDLACRELIDFSYTEIRTLCGQMPCLNSWNQDTSLNWQYQIIDIINLIIVWAPCCVKVYLQYLVPASMMVDWLEDSCSSHSSPPPFMSLELIVPLTFPPPSLDMAGSVLLFLFSSRDVLALILHWLPQLWQENSNLQTTFRFSALCLIADQSNHCILETLQPHPPMCRRALNKPRP